MEALTKITNAVAQIRVADSGPIVGPQPAAVVPDMMLFFASGWGADTMESITCMKHKIDVSSKDESTLG